ncbi:hypothetical protein ACLEPN_21990 [Myxococcus sp. 1LA]
MKLLKWIVGGACALAGALATFAPGGKVQEYADTGAQICEGAGISAYPRNERGERIPRPEDAPAARRTGAVKQSDGSFRLVTLPPTRASSTVEDVGPAQ